MNVVDSSVWLEYFADAPNADFFASAIENTAELIVPSISITKVCKRVLQQRDEAAALQVVALMSGVKLWNWIKLWLKIGGHTTYFHKNKYYVTHCQSIS